MQCILGTSNPVTMAVRALSLVLLFTFVSFGFPRSTPVPGQRIDSLHTEHFVICCYYSKVIIFDRTFLYYTCFTSSKNDIYFLYSFKFFNF